MGDTFTFGSIEGSAFPVGRNSRNHGHVLRAGRDVGALHDELDQFLGLLADQPSSPEVDEARMRARHLDEAVTEGAEPAEVGRSWAKLQSAMGALAVGANIAQIASFVQPFLS